MRVVFLDVDGVLNSIDWWTRNYEARMAARGDMWDRFEQEIDPEAVVRLNRITETTGAKICLSSTWRMHFASAEKAQEFFWKHDVEAPFVGMTPTKHDMRGNQIQAWLDEHPEVEQFVIIDDDSDMEHLVDHLVLTCNNVGLLDADVEKAINQLNKEKP